IPEGAVVAWVDRDRRIIAPAVQRLELRTCTLDDANLTAEFAQRVARRAAGVANSGIQIVARYAVADSEVAGLVHGRASHPAVIAVGRRVGALLIQQRSGARKRPAAVAQFVPAHAGLAGAAAGRRDRMIDDQRLVVTEVTVSETVHEPVAEFAQRVARRAAGVANSGIQIVA